MGIFDQKVLKKPYKTTIYAIFLLLIR